MFKNIIKLFIAILLVIPCVSHASSFTVSQGKALLTFNGKSFRVNVPSSAASAGLIDFSEGGIITIGSNASSNTTTLVNTYDLTRSSIFYLGSDYSGTGAFASSTIGSLYLTNGTTVTATRGGKDQNTLIVAYYIVQWSAGVTKSVQRGETFAQNGILTATTTLATAVTKGNAFINSLSGNSTSTTAITQTMFRDSLQSGNGTNENSTRAISTDGATSTWQVTEFNAGYTNSIQECSTSFGVTANGSCTINAVTPNETVLFDAGQSTGGGSFIGYHSSYVLTNSTTVTGLRTAGSIHFQNSSIVDFNPAYLNSNIQSGQIVLSGVTTGTATISSITPSKSLLSWNGQQQNNANVNRVLTYLGLTNATTVTATKQSNAAGSISTTTFMVLESK